MTTAEYHLNHQSEIPQKECGMTQLHPSRDFLYPTEQERYQICSARDQKVQY